MASKKHSRKYWLGTGLNSLRYSMDHYKDGKIKVLLFNLL
jgi:hypothetical protein